MRLKTAISHSLLGKHFLIPSDRGPIDVCIGAIDPGNKTLTLYVMDHDGHKLSQKVTWRKWARMLVELDVLSN